MIDLRPIDQTNKAQCLRLGVALNQRRFVLSNAEALAEAEAFAQLYPMGIYAGETMVGLLVYSVEPGQIGLWRFMVDERHQARGYGSGALALFTRRMLRRYPGHKLFTTVSPENARAIMLYERAGYRKNGQITQGEYVLVYAEEGALIRF